MKLTKLVADKAKYEGVREGRCVLWDSEIKGFGLRIYPEALLWRSKKLTRVAGMLPFSHR
jgi:hypothetical protein